MSHQNWIDKVEDGMEKIFARKDPSQNVEPNHQKQKQVSSIDPTSNINWNLPTRHNNLGLFGEFDKGNNHRGGHSPVKLCDSQIITKWDKFAPYSFQKLKQQQKDSTFLQLYEDFNHMKLTLNEQKQRMKQHQHKIQSLEKKLKKQKEMSKMTPVQRRRYQSQKQVQHSQLEQENKRLREKLLALTNNKLMRPQSQKRTGKSHKVIVPTNENIKNQLQAERRKVKELTMYLQQLKKTKMFTQEQLKTKQMSQSVYKPTRKSHIKVDNESNFQAYSSELMQWKEKYNDLQLIYKRMNQDKDKQIRMLSEELIDLKQADRLKKRMDLRTGANQVIGGFNNDEKVRQLEQEKERLQIKLRKLVQMPFYQNNKQAIQLQQKVADLQSKCHKLAEETKAAKKQSMDYYSQLQYKTQQNKLLKAQNQKVKRQYRQVLEKQIEKSRKTGPTLDYNDFYRRLLNIVKLQGGDPVWKKFADISAPSFEIMNEKQLRQLSITLWRDKLELMAHLEKAQIELVTFKNNYNDRINNLLLDRENMEQQLRIARARLDEWMSMQRVNARRQFEVHEHAGVKYDDSVSVFDDEESEIKLLQANENYFDLYFGQLVINQNTLIKNQQNKIKNISQLVSFLTVDFYNHQTQHSDFAQGITKKMGNNYSFKVEITPYFIKYLSRSSLTIQLWSPQGTSTVLLGRGEIWPKDIISKSSKDISPIIRGKCPIYYQDRTLMATVQYRIRMRLPISPFLQWVQNKLDLPAQTKLTDILMIGKKKKMSFIIDRGSDFDPNANVFAYFTLQSQDYVTEPHKGPQPIWDYHKEIDINFNEQFTQELKQNYLQLVIFDNQKPINQDLYGIAKANLTPLIDSTDNLDLKLEVRNKSGQEVGKIFIKVSWL